MKNTEGKINLSCLWSTILNKRGRNFMAHDSDKSVAKLDIIYKWANVNT